MDDISSLQIKILYDSVAQSEKRLVDLEKTGRTVEAGMKRQEGAAKSLMGTVGKLALSYVSLRGVIGGFVAIIQTTAEFQKLNAQLTTATGSADKAKLAFSAIKDFAQQTPYDLKQSTEAFISLVNRGLDPSERALRSYGDTASSMGKSLAEMVLAVSNATTGEYENLKTFGIRAAKVGDNVNFTFKGITTTVKNNAQEIEKYFIELGEKNFAGGMQRQMDTLGGAMSNFGDAWDTMLNAVGEQGLGDAVEGGIKKATELLSEFQAMLDSGQIQKSLDSYAHGFDGFPKLISEQLDAAGTAVEMFKNFTRDLLEEHRGDVLENARDPWDDVEFKLSQVPVAFTTMARLAGATLQGLAGQIATVSNSWLTMVSNAATNFTLNRQDASFKHSIGSPYSLKGTAPLPNGSNAVIAGQEAVAAANAQIAAASVDAATQKRIADTMHDDWQGIIDDTTKQLDTMDQLDGQASTARAKYEAAKAAALAANGGKDRLAQFKVNGGDGTTPGATGGGKGGKGGGGGKGTSEFDQLAKGLKDQEDLIAASYAKRLELIERNTREGSEYQMELELSLTDRYEQEQQKRIAKLQETSGIFGEYFQQELALLQDLYDKRKEIILNSTETTEQERQKLLADLEAKHRKQLLKTWESEIKESVDSFSNLFENLSTISDAFGKKGFAATKALSIAQATIKGIETTIDAYAAGMKISPYAAPVFAAVAAAAVGAQIGKIASTQYSGSYAGGGIIPGSSFSGDRLHANVNSGEMVLNDQQQRRLFAMANGRAAGGSGGVIVNIHGTTGEVETRQSTQGEDKVLDIFLKQASKRFAENVRKGGTPEAKAIETVYKVKRG